MRTADPYPDDHLRASVLAALAGDARTAGAALRVGVIHGVAHLGGTTGSLAGRMAAEELAASVPGVRGVVNRIAAPGAPSPGREINLDLNQAKTQSKENEP